MGFKTIASVTNKSVKSKSKKAVVVTDIVEASAVEPVDVRMRVRDQLVLDAFDNMESPPLSDVKQCIAGRVYPRHSNDLNLFVLGKKLLPPPPPTNLPTFPLRFPT